jgi:phage gpG-like protein
MPEFGVNIDKNGAMVAFVNHIEKGFADAASGTGPIAEGLDIAAERYLAFTRQRYVSLSKGGSDWPDLSLATKVQRMRKTSPAGNKHAGGLSAVYKRLQKQAIKASGHYVTQKELAASRHFDILIDTSQLLNSLTTGNDHSIKDPTPKGIKVGTNVEYAHLHQKPEGGRLPERKILVSPDKPCLEAIKAIMAAAYQKLIRQSMQKGTP